MASTQQSDASMGSRSNTADRANTLGEQTRKVAEDVRELGSMAMAGAGEALAGARETAEEALARGKASLGKARDGFEGYVAENPFKSILIAAGIGALIGYSLRNRN